MRALWILIKENKLKILGGFVAYLVFLFMLFPYSDLSSFVTTQVSKLTNNQVFVKFNEMTLSLLPSFGFELTDVKVQGVQIPELTCDSLTVSPSILGLISFRPGVSLNAIGLFGGDVSLSTFGKKISLDVDSVELSKLASALQLPMSLEGKLSADSKATVDYTFAEQPDMNLNLKATKVNLTSANIPTPFGPLNLPDTNLQELILKGQMDKGELSIEKAQFGTPQDELYAQVRGTMNFKFDRPNGAQVQVVPANFDLTVQIKTRPSYQAKAGLFLGFLDSYKKNENAQGAEYIFKISGADFTQQPRLTPVNSFN